MDRKKTPLDPIKVIQDTFVPELFDPETISYIKEVAIDFPKVQWSRDARLVLEMLHATASYFSGNSNPVSVELVEKLVSFYYLGYFPSSLILKPDLLKKMIPEKTLFSCFIKSDLLGTESNLTKSAEISKKFGYEKEFLQFLSDRFRGHTNDPDKIKTMIDLLLEKFTNGTISDCDLQFSLENIAKMDGLNLEKKFDSFEYVLSKLGNSKPAIAVPMFRNISIQMTAEGYAEKVPGLISLFLSNINSSNLDDRNMATILIEEGNAYRAMFDYKAALEVYEKITPFLGEDLNDSFVRTNQGNIARIIRDQGEKSKAQEIFSKLIEHSSSNSEKFDYLFAVSVILLEKGDFEELFKKVKEAKLIAEHLILDDRIARFYMFLAEYGNRFGERSELIYLSKAISSSYITPRMKLLLGAELGKKFLSSSDGIDPKDPQLQSTLQLAKDMDLSLFDNDVELAFRWCPVYLLLEEYDTAERVINSLKTASSDPKISIAINIFSAEIAEKRENWKELVQYIIDANKEMINLIKLAGKGEELINFSDSLRPIRNLARHLSSTPDTNEINQIFPIIAELQSSTRLSLDLASEHLPLVSESTHNSSQWLEQVKNTFRKPIEILQFLDLGQIQIPILTSFKNDQITIKRGPRFKTDFLESVGLQLDGLIKSLPVTTKRNPFEELDSYVSLKTELAEFLVKDDPKNTIPLLIIPSKSVNQIPFHHIFSDRPISYAPSISLSLYICEKAKNELLSGINIGEVVCWRYDENPELKQFLKDGADQLNQHCKNLGVNYDSLLSTDATKSGVENLSEKCSWLKLSCHGLSDVRSGKFGFVLSNGKQDPPPLNELLVDKNLASNYLYSWNEIAKSKSHSKIIFSTACASASSTTTIGGEQIGIARSLFRSGVLSYIAPMWPVGGKESQIFINSLIESCLIKPDVSLADHILFTRKKLESIVPVWTNFAFVLNGHLG